MRDMYSVGGVMVTSADTNDFVLPSEDTLVIRLTTYYSPTTAKSVADFFRDVPPWFDKTKITLLEDKCHLTVEVQQGSVGVSTQFWIDLVGEVLNGKYKNLVIKSDSALDEDREAFAACLLVVCGYTAFEALDQILEEGSQTKHLPIEMVVDLWTDYENVSPEERSKALVTCKTTFVKKAAVITPGTTGATSKGNYNTFASSPSVPNAGVGDFIDAFEANYLTTLVRPGGTI